LESSKRANLTRAAVLLCIGAVVVLVLIVLMGGEGVLRKISTIRMTPLLAALGAQACYVLLWSLRWGLILRAQGHRIPRSIVAITLSGAFFNNITPVWKTGGEPVRGYLMGKATGSSFEEGLVSVVVDRTFDMAPFVVICLLTFVSLMVLDITSSVFILALVLLGLLSSLCLTAVLVSALLRETAGLRIVTFLLDRLAPLIRRFRPVEEVRERLEEALERFYRGVSNISKNKRLLAANFLISLLIWVLVIIRIKLVLLSLGSDQSALIVNVVAVGSVFAGFIPLLPGGLGITEVTMGGLFIALGIERDVAASAVLVDRFISYWLMVIVGALTSIYVGIRVTGGTSKGENSRG